MSKTVAEIIFASEKAKQEKFLNKGKTRNSGKAHLKSATELLYQYYPDMEEGKRQALLDSRDYDRLEGHVGVEEYLRVSADTLSVLLSDFGVDLPKNFTEIILHDDHPEETLKEERKLCQELKWNNGEKGGVALAIVSNVHDLWVWNFADHFFIKDRLHKNYRFMPFELVGLDELSRYFENYVEPVMSVLFPGVCIDYVERHYACMQDGYLVRHDIHNKESLIKALGENVDCDAWNPYLRQHIREDETIKNRLAEQIILHNPVLQ